MPNPLPVNAKSFDLAFVEDLSPVAPGFIQTIERAPPMWIAKYSTPPLTPARERTFQSFLDALYGSANTFLGFDPRHPRPFTYPTGTPWGSPTVTSVTFGSSQIVLGGLNVGAVLGGHDYLSFQVGNEWRLYRIIVGGTANGSGALTLSVVPKPRAITGNPAVRLVRACAAMKILGGIQKSDRLEDGGPTYSFTAVQFVDRAT